MTRPARHCCLHWLLTLRQLGTRVAMYLIAAGGGRYAQDGGHHAQMGVLIGIQESVEVVRLCRGDHTSQILFASSLP